MTERIPRGVTVRIEPGASVAGGPYRGRPEPGRLIIERRWRDTELVPGRDALAAGLACVAVGLLASWLEPEGSGIVVGLFALGLGLFVPSAIVVVYAFLAIRRNTTKYTLDTERLTVRHGPMAVLGNRVIARADIAAIEYEFSEAPIEYEFIEASNKTWSGSAVLVARLHSGKRVKLMKRPTEFQLYKFIAHQLSAHLDRLRDET